MHRTQSTRQSIRRGLILISFLLFPVTINYFSPYLITEAAAGGIINGSAISFALMFLSSLFVGRAWCGWLCPGAGLQEACSAVRDKKVTGRWTDRVKWIIWFPWIGLILFLGISAGGWTRIEPFYMTESIISVVEPMSYIIYYFVVGLMVVLSFTVGSRGMCHSVCWMAPFMIIGRKLRNLPAWPSLRLKVEPEKCSDCKKCVRACPMSLDVNGMVARGQMENSECILCGSCVDTCSQGVIHYSFSGGK